MRKTHILFLIAFSFTSFITAQTLRGRYTFDGNINDLSPNGNHGTLQGTASVSTDALVISNTTSGFATIPARTVNGLTDFTITLRVRFDVFHMVGNYPTQSIIQGSRSTEMNPFALSYEPANNRFLFVIEANNYAFPFQASTGVWYCVSVKHQGSDVLLYVDGVQSIPAQSIVAVTNAISVDTLLLGQEQDCIGGCFAQDQSLAGAIDDLKFYSGIVTGETGGSPSCSATAIDEDLSESVKVYPLPAKGSFSVSSVKVISRVKLFDVTGALVLNTTLPANSFVDVRALSTGIYFLMIETQNGTETKKITVLN
jgi:hypothetical protein